ncbi:hypothetical protein K5I29_01215 [Flavobacterium agricola]|uniref:Uncharacterized protein n=1 Tax=Flavobacterium agricola TaxID=2870839 RepID=A0ABY6LZ23_9FLAO|nr:hypothetical protein [Flavobacterium agricola]UYW01578.1 hypothetical protein K5I29_01215 [Flavobacterium agricola]
MTDSVKEKLLAFFHTIQQYKGCKTEITSGLYALTASFDAKNTTWNLSEFTFVRAAFRQNGDRLIIEGKKMYYEFSAANIIDFKQPDLHSYEIIEAYGDVAFRITKIKFTIK